MKRINIKQFVLYVFVIVVATFFTFFFHEMSHWLAYELLGYEAGFTLNGASVKDPDISLPKTHRMITSASGPLFTIVQAVCFYFILLKRKSLLIYPFLFLPFVMRLGAAWANQFQANDEGRISLDLGLNLYSISIVVVSVLLFLVIRVSIKNKFSLRTNILTFILTAIVMFGLVYLDAKYKIRFV